MYCQILVSPWDCRAYLFRRPWNHDYHSHHHHQEHHHFLWGALANPETMGCIFTRIFINSFTDICFLIFVLQYFHEIFHLFLQWFEIWFLCSSVFTGIFMKFALIWIPTPAISREIVINFRTDLPFYFCAHVFSQVFHQFSYWFPFSFLYSCVLQEFASIFALFSILFFKILRFHENFHLFLPLFALWFLCSSVFTRIFELICILIQLLRFHENCHQFLYVQICLLISMLHSFHKNFHQFLNKPNSK